MPNYKPGPPLRALTISAHGDLDRLEVRDDVPDPELRHAGDVRVRVRAAALNHLDLFVVAGLPGVTITPPWVMGGDAIGVVESVGPEARGVAVGDTVIVNPGLSDGTCEYCRDGEQPLCVNFRLLGEHAPGTIADYVVVPWRNVAAVPADTPVAEGAAFTLATLTAWRMVVTRAAVGPDDLVLIWGIGGGVAIQALQIAKLLGATVWVTSGSDEKLERARALGADDGFNHRTADVAKLVRQRTNKRGATVVVDSVGQATWAQSLGALGRRGRLVTCGATSGPLVETDVRRMFWNQWTLMGSTMGNDREFAAVAGELRRKRLLPPVDRVFPLAEGRAAFERLRDAAQFGKIVVEL